MIFIQATTESRFNLKFLWSTMRARRLLVHIVLLLFLIDDFTADYVLQITGE